MNSLIFILAITCAAGAVGYLIGRFTNSDHKRLKESLDELSETRKELDSYRSKVSAHFAQTASLMEQLTVQYRKLYQHFSIQNETLNPPETLESTAIEQPKPLEGQEKSYIPQDYAEPKIHTQDPIIKDKTG